MLIINATQIHKKHSGVGVYTTKVIEKLLEKQPGGIIYTQWNIFGKTFDNWKIIEVKNIRRGFIRWLWLQFIFPFKLKDNDLLYCPFSEAPTTKKVRLILTVHDLMPINFPKNHSIKLIYYYKYFVRKNLLRASKIISISETTKQDILHWFPELNANDIKVIYNGYDERLFNTQIDESEVVKFKARLGVEKYILYVGRLSTIKNVLELVKTFYSISDRLDCSLLIVGRDESNIIKDSYKFIESNKYSKDKIKFINHLDERDLSLCYKGSKIFINPSLNEGFGMPVIEAMACGIPVIVSDIPVFKEIAGDSCLIFDTKLKDDLAYKILTLYNDKLLQEKLIKSGLERVKLFSWNKTAESVNEIINELRSE